MTTAKELLHESDLAGWAVIKMYPIDMTRETEAFLLKDRNEAFAALFTDAILSSDEMLERLAMVRYIETVEELREQWRQPLMDFFLTYLRLAEEGE